MSSMHCALVLLNHLKHPQVINIILGIIYFKLQHLCGSFKYVPYYVDPDGECYANDESDPHTLRRIPLEKSLKNILRAMHMSVRLATVHSSSYHCSLCR